MPDLSSIRLTNRQFNALRQWFCDGRDGIMTTEDCALINQQITSSLGRRNIPLLARGHGGTVVVTRAGRQAWALMESTEIYRHYQSTSLAKCLSPGGRLRVLAKSAKSATGKTAKGARVA